jgi:hypothetical protein
MSQSSILPVLPVSESNIIFIAGLIFESAKDSIKKDNAQKKLDVVEAEVAKLKNIISNQVAKFTTTVNEIKERFTFDNFLTESNKAIFLQEICNGYGNASGKLYAAGEKFKITKDQHEYYITLKKRAKSHLSRLVEGAFPKSGRNVVSPDKLQSSSQPQRKRTNRSSIPYQQDAPNVQQYKPNDRDAKRARRAESRDREAESRDIEAESQDVEDDNNGTEDDEDDKEDTIGEKECVDASVDQDNGYDSDGSLIPPPPQESRKELDNAYDSDESLIPPPPQESRKELTLKKMLQNLSDYIKGEIDEEYSVSIEDRYYNYYEASLIFITKRNPKMGSNLKCRLKRSL